MRIRIFTTNKLDKWDLKEKIPEVIVTVPVGERGLLDVTFRQNYYVTPIVDWCLAKGLSYEVHNE
jgi:hypothetical protein